MVSLLFLSTSFCDIILLDLYKDSKWPIHFYDFASNCRDDAIFN